MEKTLYDLEVTFITSALGTQPQKDVATEYTQDAARKAGLDVADEEETLPEMLEKGTTAFHKLDGKPILYDYMLKGFFKEVGGDFNGLHNVKALKSKIEKAVFVTPRQIPLALPEGGEITFCERPLRAMTAQGPRTGLARSEEVPAGTSFKCQIKVYPGQVTEEILREILDYGEDKGLLQWRNGGHGRFTYTLKRVA